MSEHGASEDGFTGGVGGSEEAAAWRDLIARYELPADRSGGLVPWPEQEDLPDDSQAPPAAGTDGADGGTAPTSGNPDGSDATDGADNQDRPAGQGAWFSRPRVIRPAVPPAAPPSPEASPPSPRVPAAPGDAAGAGRTEAGHDSGRTEADADDSGRSAAGTDTSTGTAPGTADSRAGPAAGDGRSATSPPADSTYITGYVIRRAGTGRRRGAGRPGGAGHPGGTGHAGGAGHADGAADADLPSDVLDEADDPEEHYIPPPPPPLPHLDPVAKGAWTALFGGPAYLLVSTLIGLNAPGWAALLAVAAFIGGFTVVIMRLGDKPSRGDGPDNGAVL